jgi:hypothetical protein
MHGHDDGLGPADARPGAALVPRHTRLGTVYYIAYALNHGDFGDSERRWAIIGFIVAASIVIHDVRASPLLIDLAMRRRGRRAPPAGSASGGPWRPLRPEEALPACQRQQPSQAPETAAALLLKVDPAVDTARRSQITFCRVNLL